MEDIQNAIRSCYNQRKPQGADCSEVSMPLLDHFHPPLFGRRHWESFHGWWAAEIASNLNVQLPKDYFAEFQVTLGTRIEVDVATLSERDEDEHESPEEGGVATAVETQKWAPPAATMPATFPDDFEVRVFASETGPNLVAAIELVSPANKDREETRRAFAAKCAAYLQRGIGLIVIDIVTSRHANLHDELIDMLGHDNAFAFPSPTELYATAYRPARRLERNEIDLWLESLGVGQALPMLPLAILGLGCLPVDLEATYMEARQRGRVS
jgi:Protein of unknown function (DUF4058)